MGSKDVEDIDIEEKINNLSLKGISKGTWISTGLTIIAGINEFCLMAGVDTPLSNISDNTWSLILTILFLAAIRFYTWWHNNSITEKAQHADEMLKEFNPFKRKKKKITRKRKATTKKKATTRKKKTVTNKKEKEEG